MAAGLLGPLRRGGPSLATASQTADFSKKYVTDQLTEQKISFKTADTLTDAEKQAPCLVKYAGRELTTGKQAECYANQFIGLHVNTAANGLTYAQIGDVQTGLRAQIATAQKTGDPAVTDLQKQLADLTTQRDTVFKGETLRGILLTSYGFSVLGTKAEQASAVIYLGVLLLSALSLAGFVHAFVTPRSKGFATPDDLNHPHRRRPDCGERLTTPLGSAPSEDEAPLRRGLVRAPGAAPGVR